MTISRSLSLSWTPWSLAIGCISLLVVGGLCYLLWQRSGYRRGVGLLELLRLTLVALAAVLLNQPEFIEEFQSSDLPTLAILCDISPSMTTADVEDGPASHVSRQSAIAPLMDPNSWATLADRFNVVQRSFGNEDQRSNLFRAISETVDQSQRLIGVVLLSDGDWNEGAPPVEAATRLRLAGIPVFSVPVGSATRLPDVELVSLDAPTFGVAGKSVRIPFTVESSLPREQMAEVVLTTSTGEEIRSQINVKPMSRTSDAIVWKPHEMGDLTLSLEIKTTVRETQPDNNALSTPISIREEKLRVLLVESYPRWEFRYLRNALSRDPGIDLSCLLFHPDLGTAGGGNRDYIKAFPQGKEELSPFDVVFLGDVGVEQGQLTQEDCRLLKGLVQHQASGLVFLPGWQGRQLSLLDTELEELYPVILDPTQPTGWGSRTPSHFELTQTGLGSLLTKLADSEEENANVWDSLPGFQWYAAVERARPGADVLCVHRDMTNEFGRIPLLVTRTYGAGKILFMGTDGAWRWRKGVEDLYHYRFWGQVVRWMAYQRNMAKGQSMRLYYTPDQPKLQRTMSLSANVMTSSGNPLEQGEVVARIVAPSGEFETIRMQSTGDEWGAFAGQFSPREPGKHQLTLSCQQSAASLKAAFFVQGVAEERPGRPARLDVMNEIAEVTKGRVLRSDDVANVVNALGALPDPPPTVRRVQLWSHPLVGGLFVGLLGAFWTGRKALGMI